MKRFQLLFFVLLCFGLASCSLRVEKRRYSNGWYVSGGNNRHHASPSMQHDTSEFPVSIAGRDSRIAIPQTDENPKQLISGTFTESAEHPTKKVHASGFVSQRNEIKAQSIQLDKKIQVMQSRSKLKQPFPEDTPVLRFLLILLGIALVSVIFFLLFTYAGELAVIAFALLVFAVLVWIIRDGFEYDSQDSYLNHSRYISHSGSNMISHISPGRFVLLGMSVLLLALSIVFSTMPVLPMLVWAPALTGLFLLILFLATGQKKQEKPKEKIQGKDDNTAFTVAALFLSWMMIGVGGIFGILYLIFGTI